MAQAQPPTAALVPVSVMHAGQRVDMALPTTIAIAELMPGMVSALGRLTSEAATTGFRVIVSGGRELDQAHSLSSQDVAAGTVLTLETVGSGASDLRYDDLVEAIGTSVDATRTPWKRGDSVQLSAYSAACLFATAAVLLVVAGQGSLLAAGIVLAGAALVTLAAAVLARIPVAGGSLALALTASVLVGSAGFSIMDGSLTGEKLAAGGLGLFVGTAACPAAPERLRLAAVGPAVLGLGLGSVGAMTAFGGVPLGRAAALVAAALTILVLAAPWIGLAQVPARIEALALQSRASVDGPAVRSQVSHADVAVLALRIGAGVGLVVLTSLAAGSTYGAVLMVCIGLAFTLGTRSLYGRAEVLAGVLSGMLMIVTAGLTISVATPTALPWLIGLTVGVGGFVIAWNVVTPTARPWLNRIGDTVHVLALVAVLPLTALIWGLA